MEPIKQQWRRTARLRLLCLTSLVQYPSSCGEAEISLQAHRGGEDLICKPLTQPDNLCRLAQTMHPIGNSHPIVLMYKSDVNHSYNPRNLFATAVTQFPLGDHQSFI